MNPYENYNVKHRASEYHHEQHYKEFHTGNITFHYRVHTHNTSEEEKEGEETSFFVIYCGLLVFRQNQNNFSEIMIMVSLNTVELSVIYRKERKLFDSFVRFNWTMVFAFRNIISAE